MITQKIQFYPLLIMLLAGLSMGSSNCSSIPYSSDVGALNSAQANSMEWLVSINGSVCKDVDSQVGACVKRVKSDQAIDIRHDARPYDYRVKIRCTDAIVDESFDVEPDQPWRYVIEPSVFKDYRAFTCGAEVLPGDRPQEISAGWHARFLVVDSQYQPRSTVHFSDGRYVFGRHAKYVRLFTPDGAEDFTEKPVVEGAPGLQGYSESEVMRFNYVGF